MKREMQRTATMVVLVRSTTVVVGVRGEKERTVSEREQI
jgi:hypothetical protein